MSKYEYKNKEVVWRDKVLGFSVSLRVHQGLALSLYLFSLVMDEITWDT